MSDRSERTIGTVAVLSRYPAKSMLGEARGTLAVAARGIVGDRAWAVLDDATGKVASAKRPKLWRGLLGCAARTLGEENQAGGAVEIELPDGTTRRAGDPELDGLLSTLTGRAVRLASLPPDGAEIDRSFPEEVLAEGLGADVEFSLLTLGGGAPPGTFLDYAPLHLITSTTLDSIGAALPDGAIEATRYRPNVVVRTPGDDAGFPENAWVGGTLRIGDAVVLRVVLQTPRCAIPMLAHGALPPRPGALRATAERNRVEIPGFGNQPCAGVYAEIVQEGTIREGDRVTFTAA
jgi:uncharacterized protein YcbX